MDASDLWLIGSGITLVILCGVGLFDYCRTVALRKRERNTYGHREDMLLAYILMVVAYGIFCLVAGAFASENHDRTQLNEFRSDLQECIDLGGTPTISSDYELDECVGA